MYCDPAVRNHLLSTTAKNLVKYDLEKIDSSKIQAFEELENKSHRIVLADENGGDLVFYLSFIDNKWFLTMIDRVSSDCST